MNSVIGVSHLCIGCDDVLRPGFIPPPTRYALKFSELELATPPQKAPFLRSWVPDHSMAFWTAPDCLSLEMLHHACRPGCSPRGYTPVIAVSQAFFDALHPGERGSHDTVAALCGREIRPIVRGGVNALATVADSTAGWPSGVRAVALGSPDLERSIRFWTGGLGLHQGVTTINGVQLLLKSMARSWCLMLLLHTLDADSQDMFLDDVGCTCLSFLTRRHETWREQRLRHGARDHGTSFDIRVGGQEVNAVFLRGPHGELVELIDYI